MGALGGLVEQAGGVEGIMRKLESSGLGDKLQSWIGTGDNKAISPDEVKRALGEDEIARSPAGRRERGRGRGGIRRGPPPADRQGEPRRRLPDMGQLDDLLAGFVKK